MYSIPPRLISASLNTRALFSDTLMDAFEHAGVGIAHIDRHGAISWTNAAFQELVACADPKNIASSLQAHVAGEDWPRFEAALKQAAEGAAQHVEVRMLRGADRRIWSELGISGAQGNGEEQGFVIHFRDITRRKAEDVARAKAHARLAALIGNLHAAVILEDERRRIVLANQAFCDMFAIPAPPDAIIGVDCAQAAEESKEGIVDPEAFLARIEELLARKETVTGDLLELRDGRYLERDYVPVWVEQEYVGHLWSYRDVTKAVADKQRMLRKNEQLQALATQDTLTGLSNRRAILRRLDEALAASGPVSLVCLDLDLFKNINDTHGHAAGDETLAAVGQSLVQCSPSSDLVGRLGGEEFVLVLPNTGMERAAAIAEACRTAIADLALSFGGVTASFGVASTHGSDLRCAADLMKRADDALYAAKRGGRNRVTTDGQED